MNSFSNYGQIVTGKGFVPRTHHLDAIKERVTEAETPACLALTGMPRIGKSSLAYNAIICERDRLLQRKILPIWIDCGHLEGRDFFHVLVERTQEELTSLCAVSEEMTGKYAYLVTNIEAIWPVVTQGMFRFFAAVKKTGWRIVFVLDEFDNTRRIFQRDPAGFHFLRELAYNPQWSVAYVATSRRSIADIQGECAISNLPGIFRHHVVGCFGIAEAMAMVSTASAESAVTSELIDDLAEQFAGQHPFALAMLCSRVIERCKHGASISNEQIQHDLNYELQQFYDTQIVPFVRADSKLGDLVAILFGASLDVSLTSRTDLVGKGLIYEQNGLLRPFSVHFGEFLKRLPLDPEEWPLWQKTEIRLRDAIEDVLKQIHGEGWLGTLLSEVKLAKLFQAAQVAMEREQKSYGTRASTRVLDMMYPGDLFDIVFCEWKTFAAWFKRDKGYWTQRKDLLARVRNPLAHNRVDVLGLHEVALFKAYCHEVLDVCARIMARDRNQSDESASTIHK